MSQVSKKIYCAFCKISRRAYTKRHISLVNVVLSLLVAMTFMLAIWQRFEPKALILFVFVLGGSEAFIMVRWRLSLVCPHCGFDPMLYLKDHEKAAAKVQRTLDFKKNSSELMLKEKNPFRNLPVSMGHEKNKQSDIRIKDESSAQNLSKQV